MYKVIQLVHNIDSMILVVVNYEGDIYISKESHVNHMKLNMWANIYTYYYKKYRWIIITRSYSDNILNLIDIWNKSQI
jgi:hypothetical protein